MLERVYSEAPLEWAFHKLVGEAGIYSVSMPFQTFGE